MREYGPLIETAQSIDSLSLIYPMGFSQQKIRLSSEVLNKFDKNRQRHCWNKEAGGQLFAEIDNDLINVVRATGPHKSDRRSRFYFHPDRLREQTEIDRLYKKGLHYIGDWHTHPQDIPKPSTTDKNSINECVRESKHDLNGFVLVIVGRIIFPDGLFVGFSNGTKISHLKYEKTA